MLKPMIGALVLGVAVVSGSIGQAYANTVWAYPYKGTPISVPHDHGKITRSAKTKKVTTMRSSREGAAISGTIVIAHHKPPYHDGLPRPPRGQQPDELLQATA